MESSADANDLNWCLLLKGQALLDIRFNHANIVTNLIRYEEQYPAFGDSREAKLIKVIFFTNQRNDSAAQN